MCVLRCFPQWEGLNTPAEQLYVLGDPGWPCLCPLSLACCQQCSLLLLEVPWLGWQHMRTPTHREKIQHKGGQSPQGPCSASYLGSFSNLKVSFHILNGGWKPTLWDCVGRFKQDDLRKPPGTIPGQRGQSVLNLKQEEPPSTKNSSTLFINIWRSS